MSATVTYLPSEPTIAVRFPRYDAWALEELKNQVPASARSYDPQHRVWYIGIGWMQIVTAVLEMAFGPKTIENEASAYRRRATPEPIRRTDPHYSELHLLPSAPWPVVEATYKALARLHHPDIGGDSEMMKRVNLAFESLQKRGAA